METVKRRIYWVRNKGNKGDILLSPFISPRAMIQNSGFEIVYYFFAFTAAWAAANRAIGTRYGLQLT